jgi:hypothetical protein
MMNDDIAKQVKALQDSEDVFRRVKETQASMTEAAKSRFDALTNQNSVTYGA